MRWLVRDPYLPLRLTHYRRRTMAAPKGVEPLLPA